MNLVPISIKGYDAGMIDADLLKRCAKEKKFESREEMLLYYLKLSLESEASDNPEKNIETGLEWVKEGFYRDLGSIISPCMEEDLHSVNEVCASCRWHDNQFCCIRLGRTNPFKKGCGSWEKVEEKNEKITNLFSQEGAFKNIVLDDKNSTSDDNFERKGRAKAADITDEEDYDYLLKVDNIHRANIINDPMRFAKITRYLHSLWVADRDHGTDIVAEIDNKADDIFVYINDNLDKWINGGKIDDFDKECFPTANNSFKYYAHTVLEYITEHPEKKADFIDEIVKSFTDVKSYNELIKLCFSNPRDDYGIEEDKRKITPPSVGEINAILDKHIRK